MFDFLFGNKEGEETKHDILRDIPLTQKLDILVANSPDAVVVTDLKFSILKASTEAARLCGSKSPKDLIGKNTSGYLAKGSLKYFIPQTKKFLKLGKIKNVQVKLKKINGKEYEGIIDAQIVSDKKNNQKYVIAEIRDITDIVKIQEQSSESSQYLKLILDNPNVGFYKYDRSFKFTAINKTCCNFLGKKPKDLLGKNILNIGAINAKQALIAAGHIKDLLSGRVKTVVERYDFIDAKGKIARGIVSSAPLIKDGRITEIFNIIHDIRREEEEIKHIRSSEELYKTLFDYSQDVLIVLDDKGTIMDVNKITEDISGYKKNLLVGKSFRNFVDKKYLPVITKSFISIFSNPSKKINQQTQIEIITKSNKKVPIVFNNKFIPIFKDNKLDKIVLSGKDISSQIAEQKKLTKLENIYKLICEYSGEGLFVYDTNFRFVEINPYAESYIGSRDKYIGRSILQSGLLSLKELPKALSNARKLLSGKARFIIEHYNIKTIDNRSVPVVITSSPIYENKHILGVTNIVRDISQEEELTRSIKESEELYHNLFIKSKEFLIIVDKRGHILDVNEEALKVSGYRINEVVGKKFDFFVAPKYKKELFKMLAMDFAGIPTPEITVEGVKKNHKPFYVQLNPGFVPVAQKGKTSSLLISGRDVSEKLQSEKLIETIQKKYKTLFDNSQDLLVVLDSFGKILDINNAITSILGYNKEEAIGKNVVKFLKTSDIPAAVKYLSMDVSGKKSPAINLHVKTKSGKIIPIEFAEGSVPIEKDGKIVAAMYSGRDLSFRQQAETEIAKSHSILEKIFSGFDSAILILDEKIPPSIIDVNPTVEKLFGYTKDELVGRDTSFLHVDRDHLKKFEEDLFLALEIGEPFTGYEFQMRRKDGSIFDTEHSVIELTDENKKRIGWISVIRDISARKKIELDIQQTAKLTNDILNLAPIGIYIANSKGDIEFVNDKMLEISGEKKDDFLQFNITQTPSYKAIVQLQEKIHNAITKGENFTLGPVEFTSYKSHKTNWRKFTCINTKKEGQPKLIMMVEDVTDQIKREQSLVQSKQELEQIISLRTKELDKTNKDLLLQIKTKEILERDLRASQEKFRLLYEYAPEPYLIVSQKGMITEINNAAQKLLAKNIKNIKNKSIFSLKIFSGEYIKKIKNIFSSSKSYIEIPSIQICVKKTCIPVEIKSYKVMLGKTPSYLMVLHDITREKQAEIVLKRSAGDLEKMVSQRTKQLEELTQNLQKEALAHKVFERQVTESERRYRLLFESTNDAVYMFYLVNNKPGPFIQVNEVATKRYGYTREEFLKMTVNNLYDPQTAKEIIPPAMKKVLEKKEYIFEAEHTTKDGRKIPVEINAHLIDYEGKPVILSSVRDISERYESQKKLEDKLSEMERMNALMIGRELRMSELKEKINSLEKTISKYKQKSS